MSELVQHSGECIHARYQQIGELLQFWRCFRAPDTDQESMNLSASSSNDEQAHGIEISDIVPSKNDSPELVTGNEPIDSRTLVDRDRWSQLQHLASLTDRQPVLPCDPPHDGLHCPPARDIPQSPQMNRDGERLVLDQHVRTKSLDFGRSRSYRAEPGFGLGSDLHVTSDQPFESVVAHDHQSRNCQPTSDVGGAPTRDDSDERNGLDETEQGSAGDWMDGCLLGISDDRTQRPIEIGDDPRSCLVEYGEHRANDRFQRLPPPATRQQCTPPRSVLTSRILRPEGRGQLVPIVRSLVQYARGLLHLPRDIQLFFFYALFSNVAIGAFALLYNLYLLQIGFREDFIGLVNAVSTASLALSALSLGRLLQQRGAWWCLTFGTASYTVASTLLALMTNPGAILACALLQGLATTFLFVPLMPFVIDHAPREQRPTVAAVALSLTSISATIGNLLAGWSPTWFGLAFGLPVPGVLSFRLGLVSSILVCGVALVPLALMRAPRRRVSSTSDTAAGPAAEGLSSKQIRVYLFTFVVAGGLLSLGNGAVVPFYNVYLNGLGLSAETIGIVFAAASLIGAVFGLLGPAIAQRLGPLAAVTVLRLLPVFFYAPLTVVQSIPFAISAHIVRMISISMAWPIDSMLIAETLPPAARAHAFSLRSAAWNIGFAGASFVAGRIIVQAGYAPAFVAYCAFCTLAVAYFSLRFRHHPAAHAQVGSGLSMSQRPR